MRRQLCAIAVIAAAQALPEQSCRPVAIMTKSVAHPLLWHAVVFIASVGLFLLVQCALASPGFRRFAWAPAGLATVLSFAYQMYLWYFATMSSTWFPHPVHAAVQVVVLLVWLAWIVLLPGILARDELRSPVLAALIATLGLVHVAFSAPGLYTLAAETAGTLPFPWGPFHPR